MCVSAKVPFDCVTTSLPCKVHEGHDSTLHCGDSEHDKLPLILADRESESKKLHREDMTRKVHTLQLEVCCRLYT